MCPPAARPDVESFIVLDPYVHFFDLVFDLAAQFGLPELGDYNHEYDFDAYIISFQGVEIFIYTSLLVQEWYIGFY